jgi:hypothetical protein
LNGLIQEYKECEESSACKDKMTKEMLDNSKNLHRFIKKLDEIDRLSSKEF